LPSRARGARVQATPVGSARARRLTGHDLAFDVGQLEAAGLIEELGGVTIRARRAIGPANRG